MAKACYVGVDGKARKVKKIYTGVSNVARKVKKGYVGVGGVAIPFYSAETKLVYNGVTTPLSQGRSNLAATTVGNFALFGGGRTDPADIGDFDIVGTVDAYSNTLVRSTPTELSIGREQLAATTVGNYALFGGGGNEDSRLRVVDAYSNTLVRSTPTELSAFRSKLAATTVGKYALFGGGEAHSVVVDAYSETLVRSTPTAFSQGRSRLAATTVGNYALFGGGYDGTNQVATVDVYSDTLVRNTPMALSEGREELAATTVGNYALFGGGRQSPYASEHPFYNYIAVVDAYSDSLVRSTAADLDYGRYSLAATTVGNYALFGGGQAYNSPLSTVEAYSETLVQSIPIGFGEDRHSLAATTVGNYALFGGGYGEGYGYTYHTAVDVYALT